MLPGSFGMRLWAASQMIPGHAQRTAWSRDHFLEGSFTSSLFVRGRRKCRSVMQAGHAVWPQTPKNNLWSVLWANRAGRILEQVPELLATVLASGSLVLGKGFFFSLVLWGFGVVWLGFFNEFKYVHTCIPTRVAFQIGKPTSNAHSLQFEGL